jgi:hypothetical protein
MMKVWEPARGGTGRAFVGRDRELADLVAGLDDAIGGRVRLVLIAGEPGIGKTWLAEHLAEHAAKRGARVLWVRCWEGGGAPPFWPWAQLLRVLAEGLDDRTLAAWLGHRQRAAAPPGGGLRRLVLGPGRHRRVLLGDGQAARQRRPAAVLDRPGRRHDGDLGVATVLSIALPVYVTGSDPTRLPIGAMVSPVAAASVNVHSAADL